MKRNIIKQHRLFLIALRISDRPAYAFENNSIIRYELTGYVDTLKPLSFRFHYLGMARPGFMRRYPSKWVSFHNTISSKHD